MVKEIIQIRCQNSGDKNHVVVQVDGILSSATFASLDLSNPNDAGHQLIGSREDDRGAGEVYSSFVSGTRRARCG